LEGNVRAEHFVALERGRSLFTVETGVEQMVAKGKESPDNK